MWVPTTDSTGARGSTHQPLTGHIWDQMEVAGEGGAQHEVSSTWGGSKSVDLMELRMGSQRRGRGAGQVPMLCSRL